MRHGDVCAHACVDVCVRACTHAQDSPWSRSKCCSCATVTLTVRHSMLSLSQGATSLPNECSSDASDGVIGIRMPAREPSQPAW